MARDDQHAKRAASEAARLAAFKKTMDVEKARGMEFARRWKAERRYEQLVAEQRPPDRRFPYPGHRHCGEWR